MLLAIDIGNTNIVFGIFLQGELVASWRLSTRPERTSDEYGSQCIELCRFHGFIEPRPEEILIASVVPNLDTSIEEVCRKYFGKEPRFIRAENQTVLKIDYSPPTDVGADRVVNAVAAFTKYGGPLVILDFGTATTFDAVSADGVYLGGAIVPGVMLSAEALYQKTARLPKAAVSRPSSPIGKSTIESIQAGLYHGNVSMAKGLVEFFKEELGAPAKVVATGGLMDVFRDDMPWVDIFNPVLTLEGIYYIYSISRKLGDQS